MPRADPASDLTIWAAQQDFKPPTLTDEPASELAAALGIDEADGIKVAALRTEIDAVVERHGRLLLLPTPGQLAEAVARLDQAMGEALVASMRLPQAERSSMRFRVGENDMHVEVVLRGIADVVHARRHELDEAKIGAPERRIPLMRLITDLDAVWRGYRVSARPAVKDLKRRDHWISWVLQVLNVKHPSPEHHRSEFRSLLRRRARSKKEADDPVAKPASETELRLIDKPI